MLASHLGSPSVAWNSHVTEDYLKCAGVMNMHYYAWFMLCQGLNLGFMHIAAACPPKPTLTFVGYPSSPVTRKKSVSLTTFFLSLCVFVFEVCYLWAIECSFLVQPLPSN